MRISDWSSDVCSSDLGLDVTLEVHRVAEDAVGIHQDGHWHPLGACGLVEAGLYGAGSPGHGGDMVNLLLRCREAQIGTQSVRERVCYYVLITVLAVP